MTATTRAWVALGLLVGLAALSAGLARSRREGRVRPDVVLVTVDTLRADSLGCYGRSDARTPSFDRVAREGVLFENAVAPMPVTRPSHFSLMTSQIPRQHGVLNNSLALPAQVLTVPELFQAAGYHTVGVVSVKLLAPDSGAAQGFDVFDAPSAPARWAGSEALERLRARLRDRPPGKPLFVWLHLFEPHIPYLAHREPKVEPAEISWPVLLDVAARHRGAIPAAVFESALRLYQEEVSEADRVLGQLLGSLDDGGTLLAVAADHGECFENGVFFEHASCLYEGAIRVPLLLRFPGRLRPGRESRQVELRHLGVTLLSLAQIDIPAGFERASLLAADASPAFFESPVYTPGTATRTGEALAARYALVTEVAGQAVRPFDPVTRQLGVRWRSWKYIAAGPREELFDLSQDPQERHDLLRARPDRAGPLRRLVQAWAQRPGFAPRDAGQVTPEQEELLRSLGYLR